MDTLLVSLATLLSHHLLCLYRTQITPVNYNLMIVNIFMAASAGYQLYRKA